MVGFDWSGVTNWTQPLVTRRLEEIQEMGWIKVSDHVERYDDGQVGQSIERLFYVPENNREEADLAPDIELKTIRKGGNLSLKRATWSHTSMERIDLNNNHDPIPSGIIQNKSQPALSNALLKKYGHFHKKRKGQEFYKSMKVSELKEKLRKLGLPVSGTKKLLIARLKQQNLYSLDREKIILLDSTTYNDFKSPIKRQKSAGKYHDVGDEVKSNYWSLRPARFRFDFYESHFGKLFSFSIPFIRKKGYLEIHHRNDGYIASVSIDGWSKLNKVVLCVCSSNERRRNKKTQNEEFRLDYAYLLENVHPVEKLLKARLIGEFSLEAKKLESGKWKIHNRGDAYRVNISTNPETRLKQLRSICKKVTILIEDVNEEE